MSEYKADKIINLKGLKCPMTFVRTKLALEELEAGQILKSIVDDPVASQDVPRSAKLQGYDVLEVMESEPGVWEIWIRK